jgi:hypothetical protein
MASIRGHQTAVKLFKAGQQVGVLPMTGFTANQDSDFSRSEYLGQQFPEGDQTQKGWSGSIDTEVKSAVVDELIDAIITQNLNGIGVEEITIVDTENYDDGTSKSYVYFDVQLKMSKDMRGKEKVAKKLDWQASGRIPL